LRSWSSLDAPWRFEFPVVDTQGAVDRRYEYAELIKWLGVSFEFGVLYTGNLSSIGQRCSIRQFWNFQDQAGSRISSPQYGDCEGRVHLLEPKKHENTTPRAAVRENRGTHYAVLLPLLFGFENTHCWRYWDAQDRTDKPVFLIFGVHFTLPSLQHSLIWILFRIFFSLPACRLETTPYVYTRMYLRECTTSLENRRREKIERRKRSWEATLLRFHFSQKKHCPLFLVMWYAVTVLTNNSKEIQRSEEGWIQRSTTWWRW